MTKPTVTPTPARTWRQPRQEGIVVVLPSGNAARLRPVALDQMIIAGKLPDILTPLAAKVLWHEELPTPAEAIEQTKDFIDLIGIVAQAALMEPKIALDPQADDEISLEDFAFDDQRAVFYLAVGPAEQLRRFRHEQSADVAAVPDGEGDSEATEQAGEDQGPLDRTTVR